MTHKERQALIRQPITRGILARVIYPGGPAWSGSNTQGANGGSGWQPCLDRNHGRATGRQRSKTVGAE